MHFFSAKKILASVLFCAALICPINAYAEESIPASSPHLYFVDDRDYLSSDEYSQIESFAQDLVDETGWNVGIEYDKDGYFDYEEDAFDYCVYAFESEFGSDATGVYYFFADHYTYLITSGDAQYYISKSEAGDTARLGDDLYLDGEIVQSACEVLDGVRGQYYDGRDNEAGGYEDEITSREMSVTIGVIVGLIAAIIFLIVVNYSYKNKSTPSVSEYVTDDGVDFPVSRDIFVRTYTTSYTESDSSHDGGGGFSSGGHTGGGGSR